MSTNEMSLDMAPYRGDMISSFSSVLRFLLITEKIRARRWGSALRDINPANPNLASTQYFYISSV